MTELLVFGPVAAVLALALWVIWPALPDIIAILRDRGPGTGRA